MPVLGGGGSGAGGSLPSGGSDGDVLTRSGSSNAGWSTSARLAQSGQTPAQEPVAATNAAVGTLNTAARADHVHPLQISSQLLTGRPKGYSSFDITWAASLTPAVWNSLAADITLGNYGTNGGYTLTGSTWARSSSIAHVARNITLNAGYTLKPPAGGYVLLIADDTITVNGTIDVSGESPASGAAPAGTASPSFYTGGYGGQGTTSTPGAAPTFGNNFSVCGYGGAGGAASSGGTAGGAAATGNKQGSGFQPWTLSDLLLLRGGYNVSNLFGNGTLQATYGGLGGGAGAGDGTNKGGSGGQGAGVIILIARTIILGAASVLRAKGGDGAPAAGGNAGGGGGGGAGVVAVHAAALTLASGATLTSAVGAAGAGAGTGSNGSAGGAAEIQDNSGRGLGAGVLVMEWG